MIATFEPSQPQPTVVPVAAGPTGVIVMDDWRAAHLPPCCQPELCRCECGCRAHSHYARCRDCAADRHHPPRPALVPLAARAAIAYDEWPPAPPEPGVDHLAHLRHVMRDGPEPVRRRNGARR